MELSNFLSQCLGLDLETRGDSIYRVGAIWGDATFERKGRFDVGRVLEALDSFASGARYVLGHNLLGHDLPILHRRLPHLRFLKNPVVDTLYLSPLAFPENPYHRLVKDYKLVKESLSDPVADARLAASVFKDQWESFGASLAAGMGEVLSLYRFCFDSPAFAGGLSHRGLVAVFDALGVPALCEGDGSSVPDILGRVLDGRVCRAALGELISSGALNGEGRPALAYAVAWLRVSGSNSVLPPWVRHRFPAVVELLRDLRDVPCREPGCVYCRTTHDPVLQLRRYFGFSRFRPTPVDPETAAGLQESIVSTAMGDKPHLAILPTGGGKSLCYQLPALVRHFRRGQLTVVISPLQALMKDQVDNLTLRTGTPAAAALSGMLTPPERGEVLDRVRLGDVAILYVAPEQLRNSSFRKAVSQREIGCWVFDEAHCLSKWGHDFRPDYLYAGRFIRELAIEQGAPIPSIACFTATAKLDVRQEVLDYFLRELKQPLQVFEGGVERANLSFEVQMVNRAEKQARIHSILAERLQDSEGSAVVYCSTRSGAEQAAEYLQMQGWPAAAFHAGLTPPLKRAVQEAFLGGEVRVICATNAFGMGIDKDDVRLVLHADIPGSLENYLQEAGRAGRDLKDAQCVLLYNEQDVETQFKLEAASELSQRDIAQLLRGLRRARRNERGEVVITTGELLRDDEVDTSFESDDRQADTRVKAAVAWLERAGFLERNHNNTRVFQGKPQVKSLEEAGARISKLGLSGAQERRWTAILEALINADPDQGLSADELAELPVLKTERGQADQPGQRERQEAAGRKEESDTLLVLRTLHDMADAGLIKKGLLLTAFVRHKVKSHSQLIFERVSLLEEALLKLMREASPDAADDGWLDLSLRRVNQRLLDDGFTDSSPQVLLNLLKSLSMDGRGLAGSRGSLQVRQAYQDHYRVKLDRNWEALLATARKRRAVAQVALEAIFSKVPEDAPTSAELLVSFSSDDIARRLRSNIYLAGQIKDPLAAIDRGLMFLHEQKAIILQQGLAVFRQAMTIRIQPQARGRRYGKSDFEPLQMHYRERILQIHVMNEYARLGLEKIRQALELVLAYFSMDKATFVKKFFPGRKEIIDRATSQESFRHIVEDLENPAQMRVVSAPEESNLLVLAGPGSGKTRVVVHRCAYLLRVKRVPARSILVVCFNRSAAILLRRRLIDLVGPDARGVMVQTYHGLAMRLTGTSFAELAERGGGEAPDFNRLIPEAIGLLKGETEVLGLDPDETRDRLLAGYRHILVDEYQDIDRDQYELISALAGRTEGDPDRRLTLLAVGDDDQNIYTFRGANVKFIRQFHEDYRAQIHYLTENYRSTAHIVSASNSLIAHNRDRMKTEQPIRVNRKRQEDPPGGAWDGLDPLTEGRVQVVAVDDAERQAAAVVDELLRLKRLQPALQWADCAVLARSREVLAPIRALCEHHKVPVTWGLSREKTPPLHRVREIAHFLDELKARRGELWSGSGLQELLRGLSGDGGAANPWWERLDELLTAWREESGDSELPAGQAEEFIYEALAEQRRDQSVGRGVLLSTVHGAKGMELNHVLMPDGGWTPRRSRQEAEEERRTYYVGMTRARETLCLFERRDTVNSHLSVIEGSFLIRRRWEGRRESVEGADTAATRAEPGREEAPAEVFRYRFELLGMQDVYLDFAARWPSSHRIHRQLSKLAPGSELTARKRGAKIELHDGEGSCIGLLSKTAEKAWIERIPQIRTVRVVGMIRRESTDVKTSHDHGRPQLDRWEVPWVEIIHSLQ